MTKRRVFVTAADDGAKKRTRARGGAGTGKGGMRAKLTPELIDAMCGLKADGLSNKDICKAVGISEGTLYRWLSNPSTKLHRELGERLKKEDARYKQTMLNTIRDAALAKNGQWTAAAWLLERKFPDEYGRVDRRREERPQADAPQIVLGVGVGRAEGDAAGEAPGDAAEACEAGACEGEEEGCLG